MQNFTSIPFKTESGMSSVNGVAKFSAAGIVLEFESKLFGLISDGVKEARVPIGEILDIKFRKGFLKRGAKIEIRTKSMAILAALPNKEGRLTMKLQPDDFDRGRAAVARIEIDIREYEATLPPPHPPLRSLFDDSEDDTKELTP